uniref:Uncharacterized protein n=1 Tax=Oryza rufipogon TaxID=4529 RepID=A0A0E0PCG9_ORYRU
MLVHKHCYGLNAKPCGQYKHVAVSNPKMIIKKCDVEANEKNKDSDSPPSSPLPADLAAGRSIVYPTARRIRDIPASSCDVANEVIQAFPRGPAVCHRRADGLAELLCPPPYCHPFLRQHRLLNDLLDGLRRDHLAVLLPWPHEEASLEVFAHQLCVPWLVGVHGPRKNRLPPQWLMNAAVAPCARISSCGAHPVITNPTPSVSAVNRDSSSACRLSPESANMLARSASRSTQMNLCLLPFSAAASSAT